MVQLHNVMWYVLTCKSVHQCWTKLIDLYILTCSLMFPYTSINFFWSFDSVIYMLYYIDVDLSISRVIFHWHFFTCCLTTGRGPGVGVELGMNYWMTGRHIVLWDSWSGLQVIITETVGSQHSQLYNRVQIKRYVVAVSLTRFTCIHSLSVTSTEYSSVHVILGPNYAEISAEKKIKNAYSTYT